MFWASCRALSEGSGYRTMCERRTVFGRSGRESVGVCSNCSVPELVGRTLVRADLRGRFDTVVTSVGCGWRKPDRRAFEAVAAGLGVEADALVHVGDDPETDGGIEAAGGRFVDVADAPLSNLDGRLESEL